MRLEIDIPEHQYNNIMALDSMSLGKAPYKGIIMYAINAIKHGKVLEQEPTTKNDCAEQNGCITCSLDDGDDCCRKLYEESMQEPTAKNDLGVDCISREVVLDVIEREQFKGDAISEIEKLPPVTPQPRKGHWMGKGDFITCSCCNEMSYPFESSGYGSIYHNYCPNCGADMREVKNGL